MFVDNIQTNPWRQIWLIDKKTQRSVIKMPTFKKEKGRMNEEEDDKRRKNNVQNLV